jgi:F420-non-reducing hydrogenase large subunit
VGIVEAPRGTLTHHYESDENGLLKRVNLIVGTTNNYAAISMSIKKAAQDLVRAGQEISEGVLNKIEMAFRAYDPCLGCATHTLPGQTPMIVRLYDHEQELIQEIRRD